MSDSFMAGNGAIWVQPDGPNTKPYYLGCHDVKDISHPLGNTKIVSLPIAGKPNNWAPLDIYRDGGIGAVATSINFPTRDSLDWLEKISSCPFSMYINMVLCGRRDVFENWSRSFILDKTFITTDGLSSVSSMEPGNQDIFSQSSGISARTLYKIIDLVNGEIHIASTGTRVALSIAFRGDLGCCWNGGIQYECQYGFLGLQGVGGAPTNVYYTVDGGGIWTATAVNPFAAAEDASGVVVIQIGPSSYRAIVARGVTDAGNPMEIAYSDNDGGAWTNVDVGAVNGQYAIGRGNPLFAYDSNNIWLVTTGGYVYFSNDYGVTWTAQDSGSATAQDLHAVHFCSDTVGVAVGANNAIIATVDGETWEALTGPAAEAGNDAQAVFVFDRYNFWIGYDSGNVYYTTDGGDNWTNRYFPLSGACDVLDIKFYSEYVGYITCNTAGGTVGHLYRTINGGYTWVAQGIPSGTGPLYDLHACGFNQVFAAGEF